MQADDWYWIEFLVLHNDSWKPLTVSKWALARFKMWPISICLHIYI